MIPNRRARLFMAVALTALGLASLPASAEAGFVINTGNVQATNVNIVADATASTITGHVGPVSDNIHLLFDGFDATDTPILLHGQHGVAFVEPASPSDLLRKLILTMVDPDLMAAADFKLDVMPPRDGMVTFAAYDATNAPIPLSSGTDTFAISHNGENAFHLTTDGGSLVKTLVITATVPLADIKQVSVGAVPEPPALLLTGIGGLATVLLVSRTRARARAERAVA